VHATGFTPLSHTPFCRAGKRLTPEQKANRNIMIAEFKSITNRFFKEIKAENAGLCEEAANIQETDLRKENSSLLGIGYSAQSHAFAQVWYQHPCLVALKSSPRYKKLPSFRGVKGCLNEEMRKFVFSNLQKGFSRTFFYQLFKTDVLSVFGREILELTQSGKLKLVDDQVVSCIKSKKEFRIFSKFFYSKERIQAIFEKHKDGYKKDKDYRDELSDLYADYIDTE